MNINDALKTAPAIHHKGALPQQREQRQQPNPPLEELQQVTKTKVKTAVEKMNDFIEPVVADLQFVYHEDLNEYYVTVVDPTTKEVIREIPPKKMLDMYAAMAEYMGILIDERI